MRILLFGATGGIGSAFRDQAHDLGHELVLFVRDPDRLAPLREAETPIIGDIAQQSDVERALDAGIEAVASALGPTTNTADQASLFEGFARVLVAGMQARGVSRLVSISGAACVLPGERKTLGARVASAFVRLSVRHVVEAKQRELELIVASDLDWTLPRPPRVVPGPRTGAYRVGPDARGLRINHGDVADFMVRALSDGSYIREAPYLSR